MASIHRSSAKQRLGVVADSARAFIAALRDSADAFPPLKSTAAGILTLWDAVEVSTMPNYSVSLNVTSDMQQFKTNKSEWNNLASLITERVASIAQQAGSDPPPDLVSNIEKLNRLVRLLVRTNKISHMNLGHWMGLTKRSSDFGIGML